MMRQGRPILSAPALAVWAGIGMAAALSGCAFSGDRQTVPPLPSVPPTAAPPRGRCASLGLPVLADRRGDGVDPNRPDPAITPAGFQAPPDTPPPAPEPRPLPYPTKLPPDPVRPPPTGPGPDPTGPGGAGTRLTVDQVINAVLVNDPKLRVGFEAINQATAGALTASLPPNPSLYIDGELLPLTRPFTVTKQGGPPQFDAQVTQPIDWFLFGKRAANMAREALGVRVAEADFANLVRLRVTDAVVACYDVLEAKALLDLARQDVANLRRVEAALEKGVEAGGKARIDLNQVRLDRLRGEQVLRDAETTLVTAKAKLRAMTGRTDADPGFDLEGSLAAPLTAAPPSPEEGFALAFRNRPDIESDRRSIAQATADVEAQRRAAYPQVGPMFGYTRQFQRKAIGFPDADSWWAAMTVSLPVFDRNQGNRMKAASVLAQAQAQLDTDLAALRAEVLTAARELEAARANAEAISADQLRLAREVLESVTTVYQAGGRPLIDFLNAQRTFRDTYRAYITARAAYWRAVYRYGAAIGQKVTP